MGREFLFLEKWKCFVVILINDFKFKLLFGMNLLFIKKQDSKSARNSMF